MGSEKRGRTLNLSPTLCWLETDFSSVGRREDNRPLPEPAARIGIDDPGRGALSQLIAKDDAQERRVNLNFAVVFNEP
jgi:hypothetical protein